MGFLVKREESTSFDVSFGVWKREKCVEKLGKEQKIQKNVSPPRSERCLGLFIASTCISRQWPLRVASLKRPKMGLILTPLERYWLPVSEKVWNLKIQWSDQKLWPSEVSSASIDASSRFLWYLDRSISDFNPWIIVGMRIW